MMVTSVTELTRMARGLPGMSASLILLTPGVMAVTLDDEPIERVSVEGEVAKTTAQR